MLKQVRELEQELKLTPININLFGEDTVSRVKAIRYYMLGLVDLAKQINNKKEAHNA